MHKCQNSNLHNDKKMMISGNQSGRTYISQALQLNNANSKLIRPTDLPETHSGERTEPRVVNYVDEPRLSSQATKDVLNNNNIQSN